MSASAATAVAAAADSPDPSSVGLGESSRRRASAPPPVASPSLPPRGIVLGPAAGSSSSPPPRLRIEPPLRLATAAGCSSSPPPRLGVAAWVLCPRRRRAGSSSAALRGIAVSFAVAVAIDTPPTSRGPKLEQPPRCRSTDSIGSTLLLLSLFYNEHCMRADQFFLFRIGTEEKWGLDLESEHERYITEVAFGGRPVIIRDYPKAFYMRENDDGKTVAAMDLLVPRVGTYNQYNKI